LKLFLFESAILTHKRRTEKETQNHVRVSFAQVCLLSVIAYNHSSKFLAEVSAQFTHPVLLLFLPSFLCSWINDCIEKFVIQKYGLRAWHQIKKDAGCKNEDFGFFKLETYSDKSTYDLVTAASKTLNITEEQVWYAFGVFFAQYIRKEGYETLLCCQGSTLKDWMTNINAIHHHIQATFPKMIMPQFWCEDLDEDDESLLLHYHSGRGAFLAPVAEGLITEVADY